jgi:hypothetical protein
MRFFSDPSADRSEFVDAEWSESSSSPTVPRAPPRVATTGVDELRRSPVTCGVLSIFF